nr:U3 small nucleolar ribonucleoprotein protein MPP10-like [Chlorocebus sabaeus]
MKEKSYIFRKRVVRIKPRQSQGAVTAQKRPENSLLEETLRCDHAVRMAPVITEETPFTWKISLNKIRDQVLHDTLLSGHASFPLHLIDQ